MLLIAGMDSFTHGQASQNRFAGRRHGGNLSVGQGIRYPPQELAAWALGSRPDRGKSGGLHFVEVKTRRTQKFGYPEESVSRQKIRNLINAAEAYLYRYPQWQRIQFDILAITIPKNEPVEYFLLEDVYL